MFHTQSNARRERAVRLQFIREHDNAIDVMAASMRPARHIQSSAVRSVMRLRPLLGPLLSLLMLMPGGAHAQRTSMARGHARFRWMYSLGETASRPRHNWKDKTHETSTAAASVWLVAPTSQHLLIVRLQDRSNLCRSTRCSSLGNQADEEKRY